jgi:hypothetical protein
LFTASTLLPAILYTATVALYVWATRRHAPPMEDGSFRLGAWERPAVALGAVALGAVVYALLRLVEPAALASQPPPAQDTPPAPDAGPAGERPLW